MFASFVLDTIMLLLRYILLYNICDVSKQTLNYAFRVHTAGDYPLPQVIIVMMIEIVKLMITLIRGWGTLTQYRPSIKYIFPSICYLISNMLYWNVIKIIPVSIWILILHVKIPIAALIYKVGRIMIT